MFALTGALILAFEVHARPIFADPVFFGDNRTSIAGGETRTRDLHRVGYRIVDLILNRPVACLAVAIACLRL